MRVVCWNIRAGGGRRIEQIAGQLRRWRSDVVAISEFRATPPSQSLASRLRNFGLVHQLTAADPTQAGANRLLLASRWPLRRVGAGIPASFVVIGVVLVGVSVAVLALVQERPEGQGADET